jgi:hypothetical protein
MAKPTITIITGADSSSPYLQSRILLSRRLPPQNVTNIRAGQDNQPQPA